MQGFNLLGVIIRIFIIMSPKKIFDPMRYDSIKRCSQNRVSIGYLVLLRVQHVYRCIVELTHNGLIHEVTIVEP